ncbi:anthranilate phosphoribosyltransferase [candidate division KSB1 bacterium]
MNIKEAITALLDGEDLGRDGAREVMNEIMDGGATDAQIAGFLVALRLKGETVDEIAGAAEVMRAKAVSIHSDHPNTLDTCGTGGDRSDSFNISTCAALVAAAAGAVVAKHGNRSVSSRCGSADVLAALGVKIDASPATVENCLRLEGIGFLFAPTLHKAMKYAIGPRRELGVRTIFNILGPLTNPAGASRQLLGVYDPKLGPTMTGVLKALGTERALVVHGAGMDELALHGPSDVWELNAGEISHYRIEPEELGLPRADIDKIKGGEPQANAAIMQRILDGEGGPYRDVVLLNAAAALVAAGIAADWADGLKRAAGTIDSGAAKNKLDALVRQTQKTG